MPPVILFTPISALVLKADIQSARWAKKGGQTALVCHWCVKVLGLTAQWQQSPLSLFVKASQGVLDGAHGSSFSMQQDGFIAKFRLEDLALGVLTGVGFLCHRVGVNPEDFLRALEKTQLHRIHKQAIMQVTALPGSAPVPVGWEVSPALTTHGREGRRHPSL